MLRGYYRYFLVLLAAAAVFTVLPVFDIIRSPDFSWQEPGALIIPFSGYYLDRLNEIRGGNIFLGNPYFIEHRQEIAPAFFVADWVAYLPMLLGWSLPYTLIFNLFLWSTVFLFLSFYIFDQLGTSEWTGVAGAILASLIGYSLIVSPISMQTIYPFYLLVLLAFLFWLKGPLSNKRQIFLALSLVACFYVYTYLWQIALTTGGLFLVYFLVVKKKNEAAALCRVLGLAVFLSLPLFAYTFKQLSHPFYWETMRRIGFMSTHWPTAEVYYSGRWVLLSLLIWFGVKLINRTLFFDRQYNLLLTYFSITGLALVAVSASNLITGKELELAQHVVRFIKVWLAFSAVSLAYFLFRSGGYLRAAAVKFRDRLIILVLLLVLAGGVFSYLAESFFHEVQKRIDYSKQISDYKQIQAALAWLDNQEREPVAVMADYKSGLNRYVTTLTKHYILFSDAGALHLLSDKEAEERFLLNSALKGLSLQSVENDYRLFAGNGNATHPYKLHNRKVKVCKILRLDLLNFDCGQLTDAVSFKGEQYFIGLFERYQKEIVPNLSQELKKFNISYILLDKTETLSPDIIKIKNIKEVYQNSRVLIYKVL